MDGRGNVPWADREMAEPSVVVAIVHADCPPWDRIARDGQGETWLKGPRDPAEVSVVYVQGSGQRWGISGVDRLHERLRWSRRTGRAVPRLLRLLDTIALLPWRDWLPTWRISGRANLPRACIVADVPDTYLTASYKELALFEYFLTNTRARWLYMTTTSSYVRTAALLDAVHRLGQQRLYAGTPIPAGTGIFASGANRLLSRDVVNAVFENRRRWDRGLLEDLGLGRLIRRLGYEMVSLPTMNIGSVEEVETLDVLDLSRCFHYRVKSGPLEARSDVAVMRALDQRLRSLGLVRDRAT